MRNLDWIKSSLKNTKTMYEFDSTMNYLSDEEREWKKDSAKECEFVLELIKKYEDGQTRETNSD